MSIEYLLKAYGMAKESKCEHYIIKQNYIQKLLSKSLFAAYKLYTRMHIVFFFFRQRVIRRMLV